MMEQWRCYRTNVWMFTLVVLMTCSPWSWILIKSYFPLEKHIHHLRVARDRDILTRDPVNEDLTRGRHSQDIGEAWAEKRSRELGNLVQRRFHYLQHPANCSSAKKLVCDISQGRRGLGLQLHYLVHCLITAYATHRTLVVRDSGWAYSHTGWTAVFLPLRY